MHDAMPSTRHAMQDALAPSRQRRAFLLQLAGLAALPLLDGCSASGPMTVAIHPWIGYETSTSPSPSTGCPSRSACTKAPRPATPSPR